ncbi:AMP-binding protein [Herbiconiux sp. 11R-BC]|uniref:(2,3-dihydroxybenzoyl)adenylate synthase n=1 Tax=Herbiconiux sp. 11R-BC TaxID=3111637 RepID=UPI003C0307CF
MSTPTRDGLVPWPQDLADHYRAQGFWRDEPLWAAIWRAADDHPDDVAVVDGDTRLSYRELIQRADGVARRLLDLGIAADDRVVVQLPNSWHFAVFTLGCLRAGVIPVMALPAHRRFELEYLARHAEAVAVVVPDSHRGFDHQDLGDQLKEAVDSVRSVIVAGVAGDHNVSLDALCELPDDPDALRLAFDSADISPDAVAVFLLSGGTTGLPKLIPRSHNDYAYNLVATTATAEMDAGSVYLVVLPAGHNFPLACPGFLGALALGARVVMLPSPEPEKAFAAIQSHGVTHVAAVPAVVQRWIDYEAEHRTGRLGSLSVLQVGGSRLVDELAARVTPVLGCRLQQVFGMAEGLINTTRLDDPHDVIVQTQGRPVSSGDEVRVVDEEGRILPAGEHGVLETRGPYTLLGYYRAPEHNKRSFTEDGWYITGDIVELRPDGNLIVQGRNKDMINRAGEKVSGEEVENLIYRLDAVEMVAAVAMPDSDLGERVCAYVMVREHSESLTLAQVQDVMREAGVAAFKLPEVLVLIDEMPMTKIGKIDKKALREDLAERGPLAPGSAVDARSAASFASGLS